MAPRQQEHNPKKLFPLPLSQLISINSYVKTNELKGNRTAGFNYFHDAINSTKLCYGKKTEKSTALNVFFCLLRFTDVTSSMFYSENRMKILKAESEWEIACVVKVGGRGWKFWIYLSPSWGCKHHLSLIMLL